jgi:hypothetical protein
MIRAFRPLRAGMKNGLTWAGVRMRPGRFRLMVVTGALYSTFKAWPMKAHGMLEVNVGLPLTELLVDRFGLPGAGHIEDLRANSPNGSCGFFPAACGNPRFFGVPQLRPVPRPAGNLPEGASGRAPACNAGPAHYNGRISRTKRGHGMEQLQLDLPGEGKTALDATVQEQLFSVMADIILAIITRERETGHDRQSS